MICLKRLTIDVIAFGVSNCILLSCRWIRQGHILASREITSSSVGEHSDTNVLKISLSRPYSGRSQQVRISRNSFAIQFQHLKLAISRLVRWFKPRAVQTFSSTSSIIQGTDPEIASISLTLRLTFSTSVLEGSK